MPPSSSATSKHVCIEICGYVMDEIHEKSVEEDDKGLDIDLELVFHTPASRSYEHLRSINTRDSQSFLESFIESPYFQTHAKQFRSISFERFQLHYWSSFLEALAQHQNNKPKLVSLSFRSCFFTENGIRALAWALDNEESGIHLNRLEISQPTGNSDWVYGLYNNTSLTEITATGGPKCGLDFLKFVRKCNKNRYRYIHFHGFLEKEEESCDDDSYCEEIYDRDSTYMEQKAYLYKQLMKLLDGDGGDGNAGNGGRNNNDGEYLSTGLKNCPYWLRIQLCHKQYSHKHVPDHESDDYPLCTTMNYNWGSFSVNIGRHQPDSESPLHEYLEEFDHLLLPFPRLKPKEFIIRSKSEGANVLRQVLSSQTAPIVLEVEGASLSKEDAQGLGWLLDTAASEFKIRDLNITRVSGCFAWATGLCKNTTIKTLKLGGMDFLLGALHFLEYGKTCKLETFELSNLGKGDDKMLPALLLEKKDSSSPSPKMENPNKDLISPKHIIIRYSGDNNVHHVELPTNPCKRIGRVLRESTKLMSLTIQGIKRNPEYDFIKDAVSCSDFHLDSTDFDPEIMATLINDGGRVKKLDLNWKLDESGWQKCVALFRQINLSSLDHLTTGHYLTEDCLSALCQQFRQNKGPRVLVMHLPKFKSSNRNERGPFDFFEVKDFEKLGASLAGNTKIKEIKFVLADNIHPTDMLEFLQFIRKMPSLKLAEICVGMVWSESLDASDDKGKEMMGSDIKRCQQLIMEQVLDRNLWIDLGSWMNDKQFAVALEVLKQCKELLGFNMNDLPDGVWAHVLARMAAIDKGLEDVLFCLLREQSRFFQKVNDDSKKEEPPRFIVSHHPDCPGCHKRRKKEVMTNP